MNFIQLSTAEIVHLLLTFLLVWSLDIQLVHKFYIIILFQVMKKQKLFKFFKDQKTQSRWTELTVSKEYLKWKSITKQQQKKPVENYMINILYWIL